RRPRPAPPPPGARRAFPGCAGPAGPRRPRPAGRDSGGRPGWAGGRGAASPVAELLDAAAQLLGAADLRGDGVVAGPGLLQRAILVQDAERELPPLLLPSILGQPLLELGDAEVPQILALLSQVAQDPVQLPQLLPARGGRGAEVLQLLRRQLQLARAGSAELHHALHRG